MATTIMTHCTCGNEDTERATLPFIVGNVAASADQPPIVFLTTEGVWLATKGYAMGLRRLHETPRHHRGRPHSRAKIVGDGPTPRVSE